MLICLARMRDNLFQLLLNREKMCIPSSRMMMFILMACFGFLFFCTQPVKVSGLKSMDLALRIPEFRFLSEHASEDMHVQLDLAPSPAMMFDPNQSDKRRVRRGSDPIHNRA